MAKKKEEVKARATAAVQKSFNLGNFKKKKGFSNASVKFKEQVDESKRPLLEIVKQGSFIVAVCAATTGYVVMSFVMTATPVSMHVMDGFSLDHTKFVLQSHVIAMFLPSLFTAYIVKYLGLTRMMILGILLLFVSIFTIIFR